LRTELELKNDLTVENVPLLERLVRRYPSSDNVKDSLYIIETFAEFVIYRSTIAYQRSRQSLFYIIKHTIIL
jgi:hypothetical protein